LVGRRVCIHGAVDKDGFVVFRCTLEESQADRGLEVPAWMFDRTACPDPGLLAAQPYVSIEALAALSALLVITTRYGRIYLWRKMRRSPAPSN
jgi:hypothetical protein